MTMKIRLAALAVTLLCGAIILWSMTRPQAPIALLNGMVMKGNKIEDAGTITVYAGSACSKAGSQWVLSTDGNHYRFGPANNEDPECH